MFFLVALELPLAELAQGAPVLRAEKEGLKKRQFDGEVIDALSELQNISIAPSETLKKQKRKIDE